MRKYSEYKNSDIPWIGNIPSHWNIERGKNVLTLLDRPIMDTDEVITCFRDGGLLSEKIVEKKDLHFLFRKLAIKALNPEI